MSQYSSAASSSQSSRANSPKPETRIMPKLKRDKGQNLFGKIRNGALIGLGAANGVVNFVNNNPALAAMSSLLFTGGAIGVNNYLSHRTKVKTTKDEAIQSVPKKYEKYYGYYGRDTQYAPPPNISNTSKYDAMFATPTPTPTPSISNPMNNTEINVVNHNSTNT